MLRKYILQLKCCGVDNARDWYDCGSDCGLGGTYQVTFESPLLSFIFPQVPEGCCKWKKETPGGSWQATNTTSEEVSAASNHWEKLFRENVHFESKYLSDLPKDHSNRANLGWYVRHFFTSLTVLKRTIKQIITLFRYAFEGCFTKIVDTIEENQGIVSGVAIGVVAVMVRISPSILY